MIRKKFAIWTTILLFIVIATTFAGICLKLNYNRLWKFSANYIDYADDFNVIKDFILSQPFGKNDKWLSVSVTDSKGRTFYDPDTNNYIQAPDFFSSTSHRANL